MKMKMNIESIELLFYFGGMSVPFKITLVFLIWSIFSWPFFAFFLVAHFIIGPFYNPLVDFFLGQFFLRFFAQCQIFIQIEHMRENIKCESKHESPSFYRLESIRRHLLFQHFCSVTGSNIFHLTQQIFEGMISPLPLCQPHIHFRFR